MGRALRAVNRPGVLCSKAHSIPPPVSSTIAQNSLRHRFANFRNLCHAPQCAIALDHYVKHLAILSLSAVYATSLTAQDIPTGCYVREYSKEHLKQNPAQIVDRMSILFDPPDSEGYGWADVQVLLADQGHAARDGYGGKRVSGGGINVNGSLRFDSSSCDGGGFEVIASDANTITIKTYGFVLGAGCGEWDEEGEDITSSLSEGLRDDAGLQISTRYILNRAELAACQW